MLSSMILLSQVYIACCVCSRLHSVLYANKAGGSSYLKEQGPSKEGPLTLRPAHQITGSRQNLTWRVLTSGPESNF